MTRASRVKQWLCPRCGDRGRPEISVTGVMCGSDGCTPFTCSVECAWCGYKWTQRDLDSVARRVRRAEVSA